MKFANDQLFFGYSAVNSPALFLQKVMIKAIADIPKSAGFCPLNLKRC